MEKKLYRDEHRKVISGVCAGLADYFNVDVSIIRVIFVLALVLKGIGFIPYIVLWIVLPKKNYNLNDPGFNPGVDYTSFNPKYNPGVKYDYSVPPPQAGSPFINTPPKRSNAGLIFGTVLIVLGASFLLDQFDFIPELDFEKLWPVVLVAVGMVLIFTGQKRQPWDKTGWHNDMTGEGKPDGDTGTSAGWQASEKKDDQDNPTPPVL